MIQPQLLTHPIIGFRAWRWDAELQRLRSTFQNYYWPPGVQQAKCMSKTFRATPHQNDNGTFNHYDEHPRLGVPSLLCTCGLYGDHSWELAQMYFQRKRRGELVYGVIKGWGKVQVHPDGWRSEYAEIKALIDSGPDSHAAAVVYSVPLINANADIELAASEFGKPVPNHHRPKEEPGQYAITTQPPLSSLGWSILRAMAFKPIALFGPKGPRLVTAYV